MPLHHIQQDTDTDSARGHYNTASGPAQTHIAVNLKDRILLIPTEDVILLKAENKYITVVTKEEEHLVNGTLNQFERTLGEGFIKVHRNTLAAKKHIGALEKNDEGRWFVVFRNINEKREVSRRQTPVVRRWLRVGGME